MKAASTQQVTLSYNKVKENIEHLVQNTPEDDINIYLTITPHGQPMVADRETVGNSDRVNENHLLVSHVKHLDPKMYIGEPDILKAKISDVVEYINDTQQSDFYIRLTQ